MRKDEAEMISVIMPAYNVEKYIADAVKSVLAQTYRDFELLIINDGSVDGTMDVLSAFTDKRIKIFSISNSGVAAARNIGLKEAKGEYVSFLDSDDLWEPAFLEKLYDCAKEREADFVYSKLEFFCENKSWVYDAECLSGYVETFLNPVKGINFPFHICGVLLKKSLLETNKIFFTENRTLFEDGEFFLKLLSCERAVPVEMVLLHYRQRPESATARSWELSRYLQEFAAYEAAGIWINMRRPQAFLLFQQTVDYRKYRFVWKIVREKKYSEALVYICQWEKSLQRFSLSGGKWNDRFKCRLFLRKNKNILYLLKAIG